MLNIKDLYKIFEKAGKIDEYQKILDLMDSSFEQRRKIEKLTKENEDLKKKFEIKEKLQFKNNSYWIESEGPFCSRCWDKNKDLIRLKTSPGSDYATCPECKNQVNFTGRQNPAVIRTNWRNSAI